VNRAVIALFLAGIGLPLVGNWLHLDLTPAGSDMRARAECPKLEWNWQRLRAFPEDYEGYFNDHLGFRGPLIRAQSLIKVRGLGVSSSANVLLGKDGWLYYSHLAPGTDHVEMRPFTQDELARWARVLQRRHDWLQRRHCHYLLFVPPDKQTIYPEFLDPELRARHATGRLDQLLAYLREYTTVQVVDVREALWQCKPSARLYHKSDTHWAARGAFVGYQGVADALAKWFPQLRPFRLKQFQEVHCGGPGDDLARMLGLRDLYPEDQLDLVATVPLYSRKSEIPVEPPKNAVLDFSPPAAFVHPNTSLPRAVLFHDSFALGFAHLLEEHFQRLVAVWHDDFHQDVIEHERPDVVIHELLERKLGFLVPNDIVDDGD
jgi:hypothetical protein